MASVWARNVALTYFEPCLIEEECCHDERFRGRVTNIRRRSPSQKWRKPLSRFVV
jgi:hypothetical protein